MVTIINKHFYHKWILGVFLALAVVACTPDSPGDITLVTETVPVVIEPVEVAPTPTEPDAVERTKVLLVDSGDADPGLLSQTWATLEQLATESGLTLEVREGPIQEGDLEDVLVLVAVGSGLDVSALAAAAPEVTFVAVDRPGISPTSNVSVIEDPFVDAHRKAFMAGYLVALMSSDNKMGAMIPSDLENRDTMIESFITGARFYCGICRPQYPPYGTFPQIETLASGNDTQGVQAVINNFDVIGIDVVYVHGELATTEVLTYIAEHDIKVIGDSSPDIIRNNWVGTLTADPGPALMALWPDLLSGSGGVQMSALASLTDLEADLLSTARYRLFAETAADLALGLISISPAP